MPGHHQVEVQLSKQIQVDERIAPLVKALNRFPKILTHHSCQGGGNGADHEGRLAYVTFGALPGWNGDVVLPEFIFTYLGPALRQVNAPYGKIMLLLEFGWRWGPEVRAVLRLEPEWIEKLAEELCGLYECMRVGGQSEPDLGNRRRAG